MRPQSVHVLPEGGDGAGPGRSPDWPQGPPPVGRVGLLHQLRSGSELAGQSTQMSLDGIQGSLAVTGTLRPRRPLAARRFEDEPGPLRRFRGSVRHRPAVGLPGGEPLPQRGKRLGHNRKGLLDGSPGGDRGYDTETDQTTADALDGQQLEPGPSGHVKHGPQLPAFVGVEADALLEEEVSGLESLGGGDASAVGDPGAGQLGQRRQPGGEAAALQRRGHRRSGDRHDERGDQTAGEDVAGQVERGAGRLREPAEHDHGGDSLRPYRHRGAAQAQEKTGHQAPDGQDHGVHPTELPTRRTHEGRHGHGQRHDAEGAQRHAPAVDGRRYAGEESSGGHGRLRRRVVEDPAQDEGDDNTEGHPHPGERSESAAVHPDHLAHRPAQPGSQLPGPDRIDTCPERSAGEAGTHGPDVRLLRAPGQDLVRSPPFRRP